MKSVLVTGCSRGLGSLVLKDLLKRQCNVIPHFRKSDSHINFCEFPHVILGDINDTRTINAIDEALERYDIDVFINNAAIYYQGPFSEHSEKNIREIIDTNLTAQILIIQRIYNWFLSRGSGLIINVNSIACLQPAPYEAVYSATKHALRGFSQSLQVESLNTNVKIVDIYPGAMKTDMAKHRKNFSELIEPSEVSSLISDIVMSKNSTSLTTEIVVRKFITK
tara:strand:+ start:195 stop:863 length:669 start_codon:yes stop_codon:yes gene_type:complete